MNSKMNIVLLEVIVLVGLLAVSCQGRSAPSIVGDDSTDPEVTQCRAKCVFKLLDHFQPTKDAFSQCRGTPDCFMCWDYCNVVKIAPEPISELMCGDEDFCSAGCIVACKFHGIQSVADLLDTVLVNHV